MAYAFVNAGTPTRNYNNPLFPAIPSGVSVGNLLILQSQYYSGSVNGNTLTITSTSGNWTLLGSNRALGVWGFISTGNSTNDAPTVNWGTVNADADAFITAYSGNPATLAGIVHASGASAPGNNVSNIFYADITISVNGCLVLLCGMRNNTPLTQPPATFNNIVNNGTFVVDNYSNENTFSTDIAGVTNRQIQVAAASIASANQSMTANDTSNPQTYNSVSLALLPPAVTGIPVFWYS